MKNPESIVILGDWVVDEYWYLASHISERSSHTGFVHYRVSSSRGDVVSELCGAGRVARTLYLQFCKAGLPKLENYKIHGLGNWDKGDTDLINHLVHAPRQSNASACSANLARYQLTYKTCDREPPLSLHPLYRKQPTIRVVRLYHALGDRLTQINRVDWEPESGEKNLRKKWDQGLPSKGAVKYIIIHDLGKGAVTREVVEGLRGRYDSAWFFIRSKVKDPEWLDVVRDRLCINLIGPEVTSLLHPMESLLVNGNPPQQIMDTLEDMPGKNRFLLSDDREVVGMLNRKGKSRLVTAKSALDPSETNELGWPSSLFGSMISHVIRSAPKFAEDSVLKALKDADSHAGVPLPETMARWQSSQAGKTASVSIKSWRKRYRAWIDASLQLGLVRSKNGNDRLEVWRSFCPIPNYVACIEKKQKVLAELGRAIRDFKKGGLNSAPLSIMLQADPGTGKTFLARKLAEAYDLSFVPVDVTQMLRREELLDLFGEITTRQAKDRKGILVFVDEINALLEGTQVFSSFLTPLEEGYYLRRGRIFTIKPCVWIFAGTRMDRKEREKLRRAEKLSDLESRVSLQRSIDYTTLEKESGFVEEFYAQARLEQVYLGALMIRRHHQDVHSVSRDILEYFHRLNPADSPARRIRRLAANLRNVQYGHVNRKNCDSWHVGGWSDDSVGESPSVRLYFGN